MGRFSTGGPFARSGKGRASGEPLWAPLQRESGKQPGSAGTEGSAAGVIPYFCLSRGTGLCRSEKEQEEFA